uniref:CCHC-type domain-containing protein n=1 Tax=Arundo donax TaxID=35708 RepID=A0A0A9B680_ARUDO
MELGLFWVLTEELSAVPGDDVQDEVKRTRLNTLRARWEKANASALARLLAILFNRLFDVYVSFTEARKVWLELNDKYAESDNGNESFLVASYLNFRMGDGRSVVEQIHELQLIVRDLGQFGCVLLDGFQVNAILAKLPPSWCDFVTARHHLKQRLGLNELIAAINVEEKLRAGFGGVKAANIQANLVEHKNQQGNKMKKEKRSPGPSGPKGQDFKKKKEKVQIICYVCGEKDHKANRCQNRKGRGPSPD